VSTPQDTATKRASAPVRASRRARGFLLGMGLVLLLGQSGPAAEGDAIRPFESAVEAPATLLDEIVATELAARGLEPARTCSDAVFFRRVHLDLIGQLPEPRATAQFLRDSSPGKRARVIDGLLAREEFANYWALKWCDVLRVKAEFPINLWPNAVQAYHRWVRDSLRDNRPYDEFTRQMLTSSGSNFRVPQVNFYRAVQGREPASLAGAVALTFMGTRVEHWSEARRDGMAAFFSRVAYKRTKEWKEEIVFSDPAATEPLDAVFPDGTAVRVSAATDARAVFADWLIQPDNPWFARALVNRVWGWIFGRGLVHEPDDLRPDNPAVHPLLLEHLAEEFAASGFDMRGLYRRILTSRTYQQSPIPRTHDPAAEELFASYPVRRLEAEVLIDALCWIGGAGERYVSVIPEPFTWVPPEHPTVALADGSITSQFLEMFGRPARDTGVMAERNDEPSDAQRLHLLNSSDVQLRIQRSPRLRRLIRRARGKRAELIRLSYLTFLSRLPTQAEQRIAAAYFKVEGRPANHAVLDLVWALVNSKEFLYRH